MSQTGNLSALIGNAGLDDGATNAMLSGLDTLGPAITAGLGTVSLDELTSSEVVLITQQVDDSGSIRFAGNAQPVRDGHNLVLDALGESKQASGVLISCRYINNSPGTDNGVLYAYVPLNRAKRLDTSNYNPQGGTPLYDQTVATLTAVAAKVSELEDGGVTVRAVTVIISDGADEHSKQFRTAQSVAPIIKGLLKTEQHIIMAIGISDADDECRKCYADLKDAEIKRGKCPKCQAQIATDFEQIFGDMGIPENWIKTPRNGASDLRETFMVVSQSAVRASQAVGGSFSQVAMGGFGG